ncbi:MAG: NAD(P)-dependent oxidoreductase [Vicingaceae bacterium]|nr:NAD(P)-dependent oxidoreductase [Vicingaceae bacterium]
MNILITGATGFIGRNLLELISTQTNYIPKNITLISRNLDKFDEHIKNNYKIIKADLNDLESLLAAFKNIDVVINTAAEVRNQHQLAITNIEGTKNIVNAAITNNVKKIIHLSSVGVVGMQYSLNPVLVDENAECNPKNEYERTKLLSENILKEASTSKSFDLIILRPTNVFGEHHPLNALQTILKHISKNKPMLTTKTATYNYVYVKDVAATLVKMIDFHPSQVETYNIGTSMLIKDFINLINRELKAKSKVIFIPKFIISLINLLGLKKLYPISNEVNYSDKKLKAIFEYEFGLEKGIYNTIAYYKSINGLN